ncbi:MAG: hypothetical protein IPM48_04230 [Saprospiraceae bacterium]|nr:hypothetical protein [Saprospiraceae bacterium]
MKKIKLLTLTSAMFLMLISILSCSDDHSDPPDTSLPVVTISAPGENSFTDMGDNLEIRASITDNNLGDIKMQIKSATDSVLFDKVYNAHEKSNFAINETWTVPRLGTIPTEISIHISAEDHAKNKGVASRIVSVFP